MRMVPFMKYRQVAAWSSVALLLMAVASLSIQSLNWGLDFTGGTLVEVMQALLHLFLDRIHFSLACGLQSR